MTTVRCVLFDAVGTLFYPSPPVADVYLAAAVRAGSLRTREEIAQRFAAAIAAEFSNNDAPTNEARERERWRRIVARVIDDVGERTVDVFDKLWEHFADGDHWSLFPDALAAWQSCEAHGLSVGIASNFDQRLPRICERHLPAVDPTRIFHSADLGYAKPSPLFFRQIEQRLGLAPAELLLVGDSWTNDIAGALAAGWQGVWIDRSGTTPPIDANIASRRVTDLRQAPTLF